MKDPHVESLLYRLTVDEAHGRFENPPPLEHETAAYRMRLEDGVLTVEMKEHHATVESAKERVDNALRAWELDTALARDHAWLRFDHDETGNKLIDRDPPPIQPGAVVIGVGAVRLDAMVAKGVAHCEPPVFKEYPRPPAKFEASLEVEVMVEKNQRAVFDESMMLPFGYFCLTILEGSTDPAGSGSLRQRAASQYRIEVKILSMLGALTSTRGSPREARKLDAGATRIPLTPNENAWVRAAIKTLIRRKAEYDHDPEAAISLPVITMSDLPRV